MEKLLFFDHELRLLIEEQKRHLLAEIDSLSEERVLGNPINDLCEYFVNKYIIEPPSLGEGIQTDYEDTKIDVSHRFDYVTYGYMPTVVNGTRISFIVPYEGNGKLFYYRPTRFNLNPPTAEVRETELVFNFEYTNLEIKTVQAEFKRKLEDTKDYLNWIEVDVNSFNNDLEGLIKSRIEASKNRILEVRGIVESLGFPLRSRQGIATTYMAPQVRRRIVPKLPPAPRASFAPEPTLEMEEYERILSTIYNMVLVIERSPSAFRYMQEEDIRCQFLVPLNGLYEGQATGETFNSQGKTDILIRVNDKNIFIAECKFWNGPKKLKDAIDQLLGYTTWRDCKTALLIFNRSRSLTTVLSKIPEVVRSHQCYKRQIDYDSETGFRFVLARPDDVNREIILTILVFEMPQ